MRRALSVLIHVVVALLGVAVAVQSGSGSATSGQNILHVYTYDNDLGSAAHHDTATERGPPALAYDYAPPLRPVDAESHGPVARPQSGSVWVNTTYDHVTRPAQLDSGRATTWAAAEVHRGDLRSVMDLAHTITVGQGRAVSADQVHAAAGVGISDAVEGSCGDGSVSQCRSQQSSPGVSVPADPSPQAGHRGGGGSANPPNAPPAAGDPDDPGDGDGSDGDDTGSSADQPAARFTVDSNGTVTDNTATNAGSKAGQVLKGPIADAIPKNLPQQMTLDAAKQGSSRQIMDNLADPPRLIANYGEGTWVKMQYVLRGNYSNVTVHYFRNLDTGLDVEFKFK